MIGIKRSSRFKYSKKKLWYCRNNNKYMVITLQNIQTILHSYWHGELDLDRQHVSHGTGGFFVQPSYTAENILSSGSDGASDCSQVCLIRGQGRWAFVQKRYHWPAGRRRTGLFFPLQKRTLLKTRSQRERGSLLGLGRRLEVETRSLFDSLAWRFWRIRELAIAAISRAGEPRRWAEVEWRRRLAQEGEKKNSSDALKTWAKCHPDSVKNYIVLSVIMVRISLCFRWNPV